MISLTTVSSRKELLQILTLQKQNLPQAVSETERLSEGFVTVHHTYSLLENMNAVQPHIIAKYRDDVIGYALCMHPKFGDDIDILKPMFVEIDIAISSRETRSLFSQLTADNFIVMGQVCIHKRYRKQGIFRQLYNHMKLKTQEKYAYIITEVDAKNARSLHAHYAVGFKDLKTYQALGQEWKLIIW